MTLEKMNFFVFVHALPKAPGGSVGRAHAPYAETLPSAVGLNPPVAASPVSATDQTADRMG